MLRVLGLGCRFWGWGGGFPGVADFEDVRL